jgi:hypothetical protein
MALSPRQPCPPTDPVTHWTGSTISCPVLSPDIQLLYKSKGLRPKDVADFRAVLPWLLAGEREWLRTALETRVASAPDSGLSDSARA